MVSVVAVPQEGTAPIVAGLSPDDAARVLSALAFVAPLYAGKPIPSGQDALQFVQGVVSVLTALNVDAETRIAGLLFELHALDLDAAATIEDQFGKDIGDLVAGVRQLMRFHSLTFHHPQEVLRGKNAAQQAAAQVETLRKMLLAMASDMRARPLISTRRWPTASASGSSSGSWRICLSASSSLSPTSASPRCWKKSASSARSLSLPPSTACARS